MPSGLAIGGTWSRGPKGAVRDNIVGLTEVQATIIGSNETRDYNFVVDTGATYLGLPLEEIELLGLQPSTGIIRVITVTGVVELDSYFATGQLNGERFGAMLIPTAEPLLGYELLQNLRYKVNPVTHEIEKVPDDERHPPYI
jgi:predicted aspartyl protease